MIRKSIVGMVLALTMLGANAAGVIIDTENLTPAQIAELKAMAATKSAETVQRSTNVVATVKEDPGAALTLAATWGNQAAAAAEGFAKALGIAARELGVTVNDFLHTDAGKLTAILIIWKVAGATAVKVLYGILFLVAGSVLARVLYIRLFTKGYEKVSYTFLWGVMKGEKQVRVYKSISELNSDGEWLAFLLMVLVCVLTVGIGGLIIV